MVAPNAVTVYRVTTVKPGATTFVAVDGGMGDNLEVALVGQRFEAAIAGRPGGGELVSVVGRHCESGDVLSEGVSLRDPRVGPRIHYLRACKPRIHRAVALGNRVSIVLRRAATCRDGLRRAATCCDGPR